MDYMLALKEALEASDSAIWRKKRYLKRGESLCLPGAVDRHMYYVHQGSLRVAWESEEEEQTIRFGYAGNFITALDTFLGNQPTVFHIQAIKQCELWVITQSQFQHFLAQSTQHTQLWQKLLELLVLQQLERERDLLINSPQARYQRVLARSPQLFQEIPSKYIASYLRMKPETLSRIKKL